MTGIGQGPSLMMRISIVTGVIGAFVVLSARLASAEKLTLACTFESGSSGREQDVNQVIFDTDRPRVDLRVAQKMGPVDYTFENNAERKDSIQCKKAQRSALLLSATGTPLILVSTGSPDC
jgi:hypothetical protein